MTKKQATKRKVKESKPTKELAAVSEPSEQEEDEVSVSKLK